MITTITEIFNPILTKPALKNVILTIIAITLSKSFRINKIALTVASVSQASKNETETASSILGACISNRCGDALLAGPRAEARLSTRHSASVNFS